MNAALMIYVAAMVFLAADSASALEEPKRGASQQAQKTNAAADNPNQPRTLEWQDLIPPEERDRPFIGSSGARPLFDDESGPPALQEGSSAVNKSLDGLQIRLPGFIVPLSVDKKHMIGDFLLVPYFGACLHVPPPPPNQIVYVTASQPLHVDMMYDPIWVTGKLAAKPAETNLATASYSLAATKIEKYAEPP